MGEELVLPTSGEIISLDDADACAGAIDEIREQESRLREAKGILTSALQEVFTKNGAKTLDLQNHRIELRGGPSVIWDVEALERLRELGLPEERFNELVTAEVTYKVNANEAKRIAMNPDYAEVIEAARIPNPKPYRVDVSRLERISLDLAHDLGIPQSAT